MTTTYTWAITDLAVFNNSEYVDIIHEARWIINGDDGVHQAFFRGITTFNEPVSSFILYTDITEETVLDWVKSTLGAACVAKAESVVSDQLKAAKYEDKPLPWAQSVIEPEIIESEVIKAETIEAEVIEEKPPAEGS